MAGHGWLTRAENALTSDTVNADNLSYVKRRMPSCTSPDNTDNTIRAFVMSAFWNQTPIMPSQPACQKS